MSSDVRTSVAKSWAAHLMNLPEHAGMKVPDFRDLTYRYADAQIEALESDGLTITAVASGPVEQRIMDVERVIEVMRDASGRWAPNRGMGSLSTYMQQAVRAALAPASEEGA